MKGQKGIASVIVILVAITVICGSYLAGNVIRIVETQRLEKETPQKLTVLATPTPLPSPVAATPTATPTVKPTVKPTIKATAKPKVTPTPSGTPVYGSLATTSAPSGPDCSMYNVSGQTSDIKVVTCSESGTLSYSPYAYIQTQNGCKILDNSSTDKLSRFVTTAPTAGCKETTFNNIPPGPYSVWATTPTKETFGSQNINVSFGNMSTVNFTAPATYTVPSG